MERIKILDDKQTWVFTNTERLFDLKILIFYVNRDRQTKQNLILSFTLILILIYTLRRKYEGETYHMQTVREIKVGSKEKYI